MTIKDLAARTGYSVGTVSRVLNNQSHVSDLARETILRAAEESGFHLNTNAKQLKQQHSNSVLVICKGKANELFDALLVELQARTAGMGFTLFVDYVEENANVVQRAVRLCPEKKPLGVLFLGGNREEFLADFHKISLPCVLVTGSAQDLPFQNLSSVTSDDVLAGRMAIAHLTELGHKRIAILGGHRQYSDITRARYLGCVQALTERGLDFQEKRDYEPARFTFEDAYRATRVLLEKNPDFTALFAMSDVIAIGAIRALMDAGKRVPEDVSVMGFDGLTIGEFMLPRLSTMTQSVHLLAERSMQMMENTMRDHRAASHEIIPITLESRESTRKIG